MTDQLLAAVNLTAEELARRNDLLRGALYGPLELEPLRSRAWAQLRADVLARLRTGAGPKSVDRRGIPAPTIAATRKAGEHRAPGRGNELIGAADAKGS